MGLVRCKYNRWRYLERYFSVNRTLSGADDLWEQYINNNPILIQDDKGQIVKNRNRANSYEEYFRSIEGRRAGGGGSQAPSFDTEADLDAAAERGEIQDGDDVIVNGVKGKYKKGD